MKIDTTAVMVNERGQLLLIKKENGILVAPGGAVKVGELPVEAVVRHVRHKTGLIVMAVRLVGLYFQPDDTLSFAIRCIRRGGDVQTSKESPHIGFVPATPLPPATQPLHRQRLEKGLTHKGGAPYWGVQNASLFSRLCTLSPSYILNRGRPARSQEASPNWNASASVVIADEAGKVLWLKRAGDSGWKLPGGFAAPAEPPWQTAVRQMQRETGLAVRLTDLTGVYLTAALPFIHFVFSAEIESGTLKKSPTGNLAYFATGQEPAATIPEFLERAADALSPAEETVFRLQTGKTSQRE